MHDGGVPAQAPAEQSGAGLKEGENEAAGREAARLQAWAEQLQALVEGELDPQIDAAQVLHFDLLSPSFGAEQIVAAGGLVERDAELPERVRRARLASAADESAAALAATDSDPLTHARAQLRAALTAYLRLPARAREQRLKVHAEQRRAFLALQAEVSALRDRKRQLAMHFERAQDYLAGSLSPTVDPEGLFIWEPPVEAEEPEPSQRPSKRGREAATPGPLAKLRAEREQLRSDMEELRSGLDALVARFAALSGVEREALSAAHARRVRAHEAERRKATAAAAPKAVAEPEAAVLEVQSADAELAASEAQRNAALRAAERARTQAQRMLAQEKARVLGRKTELNKLRLQIAEELSALSQRYDAAFGLVARARQLQQRSVLDGEKERDATRLYDTIRGALSDYRTQFGSALSAVMRRDSRLPAPLTPLDEKFLKDIEDAELAELRGELSSLRARLSDYEAEVARERASKLRDVVTHLNDARLSLLHYTSPTTQNRVRGFGPDGVMQARSEAEHMLLMVRYHVLALPSQLGSLQQRARRASIMILFSLVQVMLLVVFYRLYRRRADGVLERIYRQTVRGRDSLPSFLGQLQASFLWYLRRVQKPLGAWLFTTLLFRYLDDLDEIPEIDFLWIVLRWFYAGATAVQLLDAFAERQNMLMRKWHDDPSLRLRSLRLLAYVFWGGGLLLSLTNRSVGEGTIYAWMRSLLWFALLPVALLLVWWWRVRVRTWVAEKEEQNALLNWVRPRLEGPMALVGLTVGGAYWLLSGGMHWVMRWLAGFEFSQRVTAYLFRSQVQRSAASQSVVQVEQRVPDDRYPSFALDNEAVPLVEEVAEGMLRELSLVLGQAGALVMLVADRGMGKSTCLRRLSAAAPAGRAVTLQVGASGRAVRHDLARELDLGPAAEPSEIAAVLAERGVQLLLLDNLQMLLRPDVFGLREFDHLSALLHPLREVVSVVMTCSTPAYEVLSRGRPDAGVDRVLRLPRWTRREVTQLIKSRCVAEDIEPSYDALVVPRTFDLEAAQQEDPLESGYFRILWDYADGNPAVCLYFFRRSLAVDRSGRLVVVLFSPPAAAELDALPKPVPFVLRTLMQLTESDVKTVAACSNLPEPQTRDWVELGLRRGYLEVVGERVRISWLWFRAVRTLLRRQHLLS